MNIARVLENIESVKTTQHCTLIRISCTYNDPTSLSTSASSSRIASNVATWPVLTLWHRASTGKEAPASNKAWIVLTSFSSIAYSNGARLPVPELSGFAPCSTRIGTRSARHTEAAKHNAVPPRSIRPMSKAEFEIVSLRINLTKSTQPPIIAQYNGKPPLLSVFCNWSGCRSIKTRAPSMSPMRAHLCSHGSFCSSSRIWRRRSLIPLCCGRSAISLGVLFRFGDVRCVTVQSESWFKIPHSNST